jgi:hypothetical protein
MSCNQRKLVQCSVHREDSTSWTLTAETTNPHPSKAQGSKPADRRGRSTFMFLKRHSLFYCLYLGQLPIENILSTEQKKAKIPGEDFQRRPCLLWFTKTPEPWDMPTWSDRVVTCQGRCLFVSFANYTLRQ